MQLHCLSLYHICQPAQEASTGPERDALAAAEEEVRRLQRLAASKAGEVGSCLCC